MLRAGWVTLLGGAVAGCLVVDTQPCGELTCPANQACHVPQAGEPVCADPRDVEACRGLDEGELCPLAAGVDGRCRAEVCTPQACGDGFQSESEQCEAGFALTESCTELGFYGGELACGAACTYDFSSCVAAGRCGDGTWQDDVEVCETDADVEATCVELGRDHGRPGCASCQLDVSTCDSLGWTLVSGLAATRMAVIDDDSFVFELEDGRLSRYELATDDLEAVPAFPVPADVLAFAARPDGAIFAATWNDLAVVPTATVWSLAPGALAWSMVPYPAPSDPVAEVLWGADALWVRTVGEALYRTADLTQALIALGGVGVRDVARWGEGASELVFVIKSGDQAVSRYAAGSADPLLPDLLVPGNTSPAFVVPRAAELAWSVDAASCGTIQPGSPAQEAFDVLRMIEMQPIDPQPLCTDAEVRPDGETILVSDMGTFVFRSGVGWRSFPRTFLRDVATTATATWGVDARGNLVRLETGRWQMRFPVDDEAVAVARGPSGVVAAGFGSVHAWNDASRLSLGRSATVLCATEEPNVGSNLVAVDDDSAMTIFVLENGNPVLTAPMVTRPLAVACGGSGQAWAVAEIDGGVEVHAAFVTPFYLGALAQSDFVPRGLVAIDDDDVLLFGAATEAGNAGASARVLRGAPNDALQQIAITEQRVLARSDEASFTAAAVCADGTIGLAARGDVYFYGPSGGEPVVSPIGESRQFTELLPITCDHWFGISDTLMFEWREGDERWSPIRGPGEAIRDATVVDGRPLVTNGPFLYEYLGPA